MSPVYYPLLIRGTQKRVVGLSICMPKGLMICLPREAYHAQTLFHSNNENDQNKLITVFESIEICNKHHLHENPQRN